MRTAMRCVAPRARNGHGVTLAHKASQSPISGLKDQAWKSTTSFKAAESIQFKDSK